MKESNAGHVFSILTAIVITFFIGYYSGTDSKQPYINTLNTQVKTADQHVATLTEQNKNLLAQLPATDTTVTQPDPVVTEQPPQQLTGCAVTTCVDGTCSYSTGRGTCSWHGGIAY